MQWSAPAPLQAGEERMPAPDATHAACQRSAAVKTINKKLGLRVVSKGKVGKVEVETGA